MFFLPASVYSYSSSFLVFPLPRPVNVTEAVEKANACPVSALVVVSGELLVAPLRVPSLAALRARYFLILLSRASAREDQNQHDR